MSLNAILRSIGDAVLVTDAQGNVTLLNPVAERLTGWTIAEAKDVDSSIVFDIVDEYTQQVIESPIERVLREGLIARLANHTILRRRDGSDVHIEDSGAPIRDAQGNVAGAVLVFRDVSERRESEAALRASTEQLQEAQARLETALLAGDIATWTFDVASNRVVADANLARLFSVDHTKASEGDIAVYLAAIHPEDRQRVTKTINDAIHSGERYEFEHRVVLPDGSARWLAARGKVERDEAGNAVSLPGVVVDITRAAEAEALIQQSEDQFHALFGSMAQGVLFRDPETRMVTSANPAAERILGLTFAQMQGREIADPLWRAVREDGTALPIEEYPSSQALSTGKAIRGYVQGVFNPRLNEMRWMRVDAVPQFHPGQDKPFRIYSLFEDITEQRRLQSEQEKLYIEARSRAERESLLSEASRVLNESLDYKETLIAVARLIVPRFADWCAVDILDEAGAPQRVAVEHVDPEKAAWGWELHRRYLTQMDDESGIAAVLRTGESSFVPIITDEMLTAAIADPERLRLMREIGFTSVMIVPLTVRENVFGALSFLTTRDSGRSFTEEDLRFAEEIGQRAALAVENARLFRAVQVAEVKQRRIADTLQESMLLATPAENHFAGLRVDSYYEAAWDDALIGGDYGEIFRLRGDRVALLVGDCTGKGLAAARFVAECQFMARAYLRESPDDPARALTRLNTMLVESQQLDSRPENALTTLVVAILDCVTGEVVLSAGGAEPPLVIRAATGRAEEIEVLGALLGMDTQANYDNIRLTLAPGDLLILTTDGTTEARNKKTREFFGYKGLMRAAEEIAPGNQSLRGIAREIIARAKQFAGGVLSDDTCVVVARYTGM